MHGLVNLKYEGFFIFKKIIVKGFKHVFKSGLVMPGELSKRQEIYLKKMAFLTVLRAKKLENIRHT